MRILVLIVMLLCCQAAVAQPAPRPRPRALTDVYACAQLQADATRLACYDAAVPRLREAEAQGQIIAFDRAQVDTIERESFGLSLPSLAGLIPSVGDTDGAQSGLDGVEMEVARIEQDPRGRLTFFMTNGQIWTQVEAERRRNVRTGDTIIVRRAALGSFLLVPEHGGAGQRVRRQN